MEKDVIVRSCLISTIEAQCQRSLMNCKTASGMWTRLAQEYQPNAVENKHLLCDTFYKFQYGESNSVMSRAWIFGQIPHKYLQSQLHAVCYRDVSDDADSDPVSLFCLILPFLATFSIIQTYFAYFSTIEDKLPNSKVSEKLKMVLEKNVGYNTICQISKIIDGEPSADFTTEPSPSEISAFLYAPITSRDVERSFYVYKSILADNRKTFEFENFLPPRICVFH